MKTIILAGGLGTRLQEETVVKPKPMVEVGGRPVLWHIMNIYRAHGHKEFGVALGYKGEMIKNYFLNYYHQRNSLTVRLADGHVDVHGGDHEDWTVHLIDTGLRTDTGGRIKRLAPLIGKDTFLMTYGDGVTDVNLGELVAFHRRKGKLATVTAVRPPARFGGLGFQGDLVTRFVEKPQLGEGWINGGFFVLEPKVLDYIDGDATVFEREPLERLARDGQLVAYRHEGFWQCMDTLRDVRQLEALWESGKAPWKVWDEAPPADVTVFRKNQ
jgi:glucose-1-phosphate cytidylyltransferase